MAPAHPTPSPQLKCAGFFSSELAPDGSAIDVSCVGVTSALRNAYVDLAEHAEGRQKPAPNTGLSNLSCVGAAIYQQQPDANTGTVPPPACLGVEFIRYREIVMHSSAAAAAAAAGHMHHHHHMHGGGQQHQDIELLQHAAASDLDDGQQASTSGSSSAGALPSSPADAYMRHAQQHQHQQQRQGPHTADGTGPAAGAADEYRGRPSLVQRLTELHAEVSERLEGQDPMWFGKAFAARARLNWDSMVSMGGQVLEAAKQDLGLAPSSKSSDSSSDREQ